MTKKENPQRILSKNFIVHAFLELMKEKPFKEINITELSERAAISRRTFYRHFETTEQVFEYTLQEIANKFILYYRAQGTANFEELIYAYFSFWEQRKDFLLLLAQNGSLNLFCQKFLTKIGDILMENIVSSSKDIGDIDYIYAFSAGGICNMLTKWIENGAKETPERMSKYAHKIINHLK